MTSKSDLTTRQNIVFNTWPGAFLKPGGGEVQLLQSKKALEARGYKIDLFDMWTPQSNFAIYHQFSVVGGLEDTFNAYKRSGKKIILSPILWGSFPVESDAYRYIHNMLVASDAVLTNSQLETIKITSDFSLDIRKFHKVRNAIDNCFQEDGDPELFRHMTGVSGDFVLSVANIDTRKNTKELVRACKALELPLISIGHIKDVSYYESFKHEYKGLVHLGPIQDASILMSAYRACRVFALPSLCETPSIAALEAGSQGAAIVITREGSTEEYFGDFARYVDPLKSASIIEALRVAWADGPRPGTSNHIRREYTWDKAAVEISKVYELVLASK